MSARRLLAICLMTGVFLGVSGGPDPSVREASGSTLMVQHDDRNASLLAAAEQIRHQGFGVPFVLNQGQKDPRVLYYAATFGGTVFVTTKREIVYSLPKVDDGIAQSGWAIREQLIGGAEGRIRSGGKKDASVNIFEGRDPLKWKQRVPTYGSIFFDNVYPGIDLELKAHRRNVEKLFHVKPAADVSDIKVRLEGIEGVRITQNGELEMATAMGSVLFTKPVAWQDVEGVRVDVPAEYVVLAAVAEKDVTYGFSVAAYDRSLPLVIDPLLASTLLGGSADDHVYDMLLDGSGDVVLTGYTFSADLPTVPGAFDASYNGGNHDVFVARMNKDLTGLAAATFLGGGQNEHPHSIALDAFGNLVLVGTTNSPNYPTTSGAYQRTLRGNYDVFVSRLSSDLSMLLASTLVGGSSAEDATRVVLDASGDVYVVGVTYSSNYPVTSGAYDVSYNGGGDVFVSRLDHSLERLLSSTFLGGSRYDDTYTLALDAEGNAFIAGYTNSIDFPATAGSYDATYNGGTYDVFVAKLSGDLVALSASTLLGGGGLDFASALAIDSTGRIFVAGRTASSNFPTTTGAYRTTPAGGSDAFVARMNGQLSILSASTVIGGSNDDAATALMLDQAGDVVIAGYSSSTDYPVSLGAYDGTHNGGSDIIVSKLSENLSELLASSFLGGRGNDNATAIALDGSGAVVIAGYTDSTDYPTTAGAYDTFLNGGYDSFVTRLDGALSSNRPPQAHAGPDQTVEVASCEGAATTLDGSVSSDPDGDTLSYIWTEDGAVIAVGVNPTVTLPYGSHTITLTVDDGKGGTDTDEVVIKVVDTTEPSLSVTVSPNMLWPPHHKYVKVAPAISVSDACSATVQVQRLSASSNEPDNGLGDGDTADDIAVNDDGTLLLRAERSGKGGGRVYTLVYEATDAAGNSTTATATVTVPHSNKK